MLRSQLAARQRYTISGQFPKHLTPPPSHPGSPRGSLEISAPPTPPYQRRYIAPVLHRAFTPDEDDVESDREAGESVELSLFPTSVYRSRADSKNTTKSARSGMSLPPCRDLRRSAELSHREATRSTDRQDFRQDSRSMTPDQRYANVAPMSAAFARLSHKVRVHHRLSFCHFGSMCEVASAFID